MSEWYDYCRMDSDGIHMQKDTPKVHTKIVRSVNKIRSASLMRQDSVPIALPSFSNILSQEQYTDTSESENDDAGINWGRSIDHEKRTTEQGGYHASSVQKKNK
jgi:hypothetical protein